MHGSQHRILALYSWCVHTKPIFLHAIQFYSSVLFTIHISKHFIEITNKLKHVKTTTKNRKKKIKQIWYWNGQWFWMFNMLEHCMKHINFNKASKHNTQKFMTWSHLIIYLFLLCSLISNKVNSMNSISFDLCIFHILRIFICCWLCITENINRSHMVSVHLLLLFNKRANKIIRIQLRIILMKNKTKIKKRRPKKNCNRMKQRWERFIRLLNLVIIIP